MWYTGCIPCRYLARELKEIKKEMKSSEDVLFVSLSFDKYRDVWLESLKSGEYTHEDGVNLWIGEKATKHPIVEYYGIFGYPTLLIVDREGNLAERNPPRPVYTDPHSRVIFKSLIQKYR